MHIFNFTEEIVRYAEFKEAAFSCFVFVLNVIFFFFPGKASLTF